METEIIRTIFLFLTTKSFLSSEVGQIHLWNKQTDMT
jgi:hypothetical protein